MAKQRKSREAALKKAAAKASARKKSLIFTESQAEAARIEQKLKDVGGEIERQKKEVERSQKDLAMAEELGMPPSAVRKLDIKRRELHEDYLYRVKRANKQHIERSAYLESKMQEQRQKFHTALDERVESINQMLVELSDLKHELSLRERALEVRERALQAREHND